MKGAIEELVANLTALNLKVQQGDAALTRHLEQVARNDTILDQRLQAVEAAMDPLAQGIKETHGIVNTHRSTLGQLEAKQRETDHKLLQMASDYEALKQHWVRKDAFDVLEKKGGRNEE